MAKNKPGLPPGFDLSVTQNELIGKPAKLPGYLERTGMHVLPPSPEPQSEKVVPIVAAPSEVVVRKFESVQVVTPTTQQPTIADHQVLQPQQPTLSRSGKRAQINLPPDIKTKLVEMSRQFSSQTNGQELTRSDIVVGLILALYEAKDLVNVGALPVRGKWGTSTSKSIGPALTLAFQEALQELGRKSGGNPFEKFKEAVGR